MMRRMNAMPIFCCLLFTGWHGTAEEILTSIHVVQVPDPRLKTLADIQRKFVTQFINTMGFGVSRMETISMRSFARINSSFLMGGENWNIDQLNLIGLLFHDGRPAVFDYFGEKEHGEKEVDAIHNSNMRNLPKGDPTQIRAPDEFESTAIHKLELGEQLVTCFDNNEIRMVGAIRAENRCLGCHQFRENVNDSNAIAKQPLKENDLLGAFTYRIKHARENAKLTEQ